MMLRPLQLKLRLSWIKDFYRPGKMSDRERARLRQAWQRAKRRLSEMGHPTLFSLPAKHSHAWNAVLAYSDCQIGWRCDCGKVAPLILCGYCRKPCRPTTYGRVIRYCNSDCREGMAKKKKLLKRAGLIK